MGTFAELLESTINTEMDLHRAYTVGRKSLRPPCLEIEGQRNEWPDSASKYLRPTVYAAEFSISESELERTEPSPTTRAYTDFLVRVAATETFGDLVAALLPCMWGFNETGKRLAAQGMPTDERYAEWIEMYSGEEFTELTYWCKDLMDDVAEDASEAERERYRDLFRTSARYEYRFWDAAWNQER